MDDLIDHVGGAPYITTLDLTKGYWQVPVAKEDQEKTAFATPWGLFQFTRIPFGLQGAPATFQRTKKDQLLDGLGDLLDAYLDDVIIFSQSWDDHMKHLQVVLHRIQQAGLMFKERKCQFVMPECVYLGHTIGSGKIRPEVVKVKAIKKFEQPLTKKGVISFLGITGYYRKFIPKYASLATPLTNLKRKDQPAKVIWTPVCETAF